jgi:heme-degrading monooxygenase HmoA
MIATTPKPPYYAVVFTSLRREEPNDGYGETAERMEHLAAEQPGFLGLESTRGPDGLGITVAYFDSLESIRAWKANAEHQAAQRKGREAWYEAYRVRVCKVEREYGFER